MTQKIERALYAKRRMADATLVYYELVRIAFPIGARVRWTHGSHWRSADVVAHSRHDDRLKVRGTTGKEYWLSAANVIGDAEREFLNG